MQRLTLVAWACLAVLPLIITAYPWEEAGANEVGEAADKAAMKNDVLAPVNDMEKAIPYDAFIQENEPVEGYGEGANELFNSYDRLAAKRTADGGNEWCARWGDFCRPNAKIKYAQCCEGLRCMCGHFWTQGKCQCKSKATFGR